MSLKAFIGQNECVFDQVQFESIDRSTTVTLTASKACPFEISFTYKLEPKGDYSPEDYHLFLFKNPFHAENDIFQVYEKDLEERIGWIFPIQALFSGSHSFRDNDHFLKYARVSILKLCLNDDKNLVRCPQSHDGYGIDILDFYDDDDILMILSKEKLKEIEGFKIQQYLPSLYKFGYFFIGYSRDIQYFNHGKNELYENINVRVTIKRSSESLWDEEFITSLFERSLPFERHYLVRFLFLYQIVELLMERIFRNEFSQKMQELGELKDHDTLRFYDIKDYISEISSEKNRLEKIFNEYTKSKIVADDLKEACDLILKRHGFGEYKSLAKALYATRNLLVHGLRNISTELNEEIEEMNRHLERVVVDLITAFKLVCPTKNG